MDNQEFKGFEERRRYPRVGSSLPVKYKNLRNIGGLAVGSLSKDICEGGVRFRTNEFISLACRLVVEVSLPTVPRPIKAISKVAWIRKASGDYYEMGNQFLEITKEDRSHLSDFINSMIKT